jgi:hypothetical protein
MTRNVRQDVDPERSAPKNPFDHAEGTSGQSYSQEREQALRTADPSGGVNADPASGGDGAGARATIDPSTGEARGSGAEADPDRKPS